jgi:hypothetical protein
VARNAPHDLSLNLAGGDNLLGQVHAQLPPRFQSLLARIAHGQVVKVRLGQITFQLPAGE